MMMKDCVIKKMIIAIAISKSLTLTCDWDNRINQVGKNVILFPGGRSTK